MKLKEYNKLPFSVGIEYDGEKWTAWHPELGKGSCYASAKTKIKALKLLEKDRKDFLRLLIQEKIEIPKPTLFNLD